MNNVTKLLNELLDQQDIAHPNHRILFLNFNPESSVHYKEADYFQHFNPETQSIDIDIEDNKEHDDLVVFQGTKNVKETRYFITKALLLLKPAGLLLIAADNKENGNRLRKWMENLNLEPKTFSGHKAKAVLVQKTKYLNQDIVLQWEKDGRLQKNQDGFYSQPGLFSWDHIDPASALLVNTIDEQLSGHIADFGCGYGYLSYKLLEKNPNITSLTGYDVDQRALKCFQKNMQHAQTNLKTEWVNLSQPYQSNQKYDYILMNPPFHKGRKDLPSLGIHFIENAAGNLKKGGVLWMVANTHLPYETALSAHFQDIRKKIEEKGFKVFRAVK